MTTVRPRAAAYLLMCLLAACGDDDTEAEVCFVALEDWCATHDCGPTRTIDDALQRLPPNSDAGTVGPVFTTFLEAYECDNLLAYRVGDGFVGVTLYYDAPSGELVGSSSFSDIIDEACPMGRGSGRRPSGDCDRCTLIGVGLFARDACQGELAAPYVDLCMREPPSSLADCAQCACAGCYPPAIACAAIPQDAGASGEDWPRWDGECELLLLDCSEEQGCGCSP